jgi:transmembrane sensor
MEQSKLNKEQLEEFFKGNFTEEETSDVESLFCEKDNEKLLKKVMSKQFTGIMHDNEPDVKNLDHILHKIHYDINTRSAEKRSGNTAKYLSRALRIAAIIVLPLLLFWATKGFFNSRSGQQAWVEIKAPAWTRAQFTLPDGTTGWLNSNSSVKYNLDFMNDRKVILYGEAFFDVLKDPHRPFRVNTDDVVINVKGTRFNVSSYENEKNVEVVLEEGSLIFNDKGLKNTYPMKPNDLLIYDKALRKFTTEVVQPQKYLSWTEGKLVFRNDPLDVICRRLGRWYNVDVEVNVGSVENLRLRATFVDENLEEVLGLLRRSLPINYKIQEGMLNKDNTYSKKKVTILPKHI